MNHKEIYMVLCINWITLDWYDKEKNVAAQVSFNTYLDAMLFEKKNHTPIYYQYNL